MLDELEPRGRGFEWAVSQARRQIHNSDVEGLRPLLAQYPALLTWTAGANDGGLLGMATGSYGDSGDAFREERFTRRACAELLLDSGAIVPPPVCEGLIRSRAKGLIALFQQRGLFPQTLKFFAALGDLDGIRASLDANSGDVDVTAVNEAFLFACHLGQASAAALLLDRSIALDGAMGQQVDRGPGRSALVQSLIADKPDLSGPVANPWQAYVKQQAVQAMRESNLASFVDLLRREDWILSEPYVPFQVALIELAVVSWTGTKPKRDYGVFISSLFDLDPAILHTRVPPPSAAIHFAFTYATTHLLPLLLRIWPLPDDLAHAAGLGDLGRVQRWFGEDGKPALGDLAKQYPANDAQYRRDLQSWFGRDPDVQDVLDTAFAWSVLNNRFEVADFLLAHGGNIDTPWSSHEPASILHELVWHENYEAMQFLIDRGIDMTVLDFRWNATAIGWATYAGKDEKMAQWLRDAQQRRDASHRVS